MTILIILKNYKLQQYIAVTDKEVFKKLALTLKTQSATYYQYLIIQHSSPTTTHLHHLT